MTDQVKTMLDSLFGARRPTAWVTRERPKIDRIACPWLVRRFVDQDARILFVPTDRVFAVAEGEGAVAFDIPGATFSHVGDECSFDAFLAAFGLAEEAGLARLAPIVRGADTDRHDLAPEAAGRLTETLILSRRDVAALMGPADWLEAVERGFRAGAEGKAVLPLPLHIPAEGGGFHAKGALITQGRDWAALKLNGNFPDNPRRGLPTVQGALILADGADGRLLAVMDSIELTLRRTAAASALAARLLARPESRTLLICGCGEQGRAHLQALAAMLPLVRCFVWDVDRAKADAFAREQNGLAGVTVEAVEELTEAARLSDVIATCTSARSPFLAVAHVRPGTFVAAVGGDNPDKSELGPDLMAAATIVTDSTAQCLAMGDLAHAVAAGAVEAGAVHAELGEIVTGTKPGRAGLDEIIVFDSTGTALQDVAAASMVYERALAAPDIHRIDLGAA